MHKDIKMAGNANNPKVTHARHGKEIWQCNDDDWKGGVIYE